MDRDEGAVANRPAFCICIDTLYEGRVPSVRDGEGQPCIFTTLVEAQREIADLTITRLQEFLAGEREFDDAMCVDEYIVEVDILPDGSVIDSEGDDFWPPTQSAEKKS
jgi:hypothetical protein